MGKDNSLKQTTEVKDNQNPIIKAVKPLLITCSAVVVFSSVLFPFIDVENIFNKTETEIEQKKENYDNLQLSFHVDNYGDKQYLSLDENDFLILIEQAMKEVDTEYLGVNATPIFSDKDKAFSRFDKYHILGIFMAESSLRLLEIKDEHKSMYDINNYGRFYGVDEDGVKYFGLGMMNKSAVNHIVKKDRTEVNNFKNPESIKIDGKNIKISFEQLNPYDYIIASGAKTIHEIEQALKECIILNAKCVYILLNRIVKDNVKIGTHNEELQILNSYVEYAGLSTEDKQMSYAFVAYNNGMGKTRENLLNGKFFSKYTSGENKGEYILNFKYADKVFENAISFENRYNIDLD